MAYRVVPDNLTGGWDVKKDDDPQAQHVHFDTEKDAVVYGQRVSNIEREDLLVYTAEGDLSWRISRNENGAELVIADESGELPRWVDELLQGNIRGIPQGQIQPKSG